MEVDEEGTESQDSSIEDPEGAEVLSAAEALLGLKHLGRFSSPVSVSRITRAETSQVDADHHVVHPTTASPSTTPSTRIIIRHSSSHERTHSRAFSKLDPESSRLKPPKRRRAASPSTYVRSASVGCTSVPPSIQRQWSGHSTSSTEQSKTIGQASRSALDRPKRVSASACTTKQPWRALVPKRQDVL